MNSVLGPRPLLVSGLARSGTTYLANLLNCHPEIIVTNESRIFMAPIQYRRSAMLGPLSLSTGPLPLSLADVVEETIREQIFKLAEKTRKVRLHFNDGRPLSVEVTQERLLYLGDKFPNYATDPYIGPFLKDFFPESRWIFIFRSPFATIRSQLRMRMQFDQRAALSEYINQMRQAAQLKSLAGPSRFFSMSYEQLVSQAESLPTVRAMANFLEVRPSPFELFLSDPSRNQVSYSSGSRDAADYNTENDTLLSGLEPNLRREITQLLSKLRH
jgi:hypothetical protein